MKKRLPQIPQIDADFIILKEANLRQSAESAGEKT